MNDKKQDGAMPWFMVIVLPVLVAWEFIKSIFVGVNAVGPVKLRGRIASVTLDKGQIVYRLWGDKRPEYFLEFAPSTPVRYFADTARLVEVTGHHREGNKFYVDSIEEVKL